MIEELADSHRSSRSEGPHLRERLAYRCPALLVGRRRQVADEDAVLPSLNELLRLDSPVGKLIEKAPEGFYYVASAVEDLRARHFGHGMPLKVGVEANERRLEVVAVERLVRRQVCLTEGFKGWARIHVLPDPRYSDSPTASRASSGVRKL